MHESIEIGEVTITNSTCKSLVTWVNGTPQSDAEDSLFQEVLLMDGDSKIIYVSIIDQDIYSYRDDTTNVTSEYMPI